MIFYHITAFSASLYPRLILVILGIGVYFLPVALNSSLYLSISAIMYSRLSPI